MYAIYSAGSGPCARPRDFQNRLLNVVLGHFEGHLRRQSWNRLLQHFWSTDKETASRQRPTGHRLHAPSSIMAAPASEDFTSPPEAHDTSNVETGERRDMFTLTFSTVCSVEKLSAHSCPSKCSSESGPRVLRCSKPRT